MACEFVDVEFVLENPIIEIVGIFEICTTGTPSNFDNILLENGIDFIQLEGSTDRILLET